MVRIFSGFVTVLLLGSSALASDATVVGSYLEARTADVWTGPCFANGEVNLTGKEALMAWKVEKGTWNNVSLDGLSVVAVIRASATLGDPYAQQLPVKSVLVVDEKANSLQREALVSFARSMGGDLLSEIVWVRSAPIEVTTTPDSGYASLKAGEYAQLKTRALNHHDMHCGNEFIYYAPLSEVASAMPAYALVNRFDGDGLGSVWSSPAKRSAFVGVFAR